MTQADGSIADEIALGPIDYLVVEWTTGKPDGSAIPHIIDLVERGIVRILDVAFIQKGDDGSVTSIGMDELGVDFTELDGASADLLGDDDLAEAASALAPGAAAAVIVWENTWAEPLVTAFRDNGAQVVASGRIPADALLEALDAVES